MKSRFRIIVNLPAVSSVLVALCAMPAQAQQADNANPAAAGPTMMRLGGDLPAILGEKEHLCLVTADIYVPSGKTVRIKPGTALLFRNFTGLHVEGQLLVDGTKEKPVIFTSEFDGRYNPVDSVRANAYDWNGIYIHESGLGSVLANCAVVYSVYGINSLTKFIRLDQVTFADNGRADLTIENGKIAVSRDPFSYAIPIKDARIDGVPVKILMDPEMPRRNALRYSGLSLAVGGASMGTWFSVQQARDRQKIAAMADTAVTGLESPLVKYSPDDYDGAVRQRNVDIGLLVSGFCLSALGAAGLGFSFTF